MASIEIRQGRLPASYAGPPTSLFHKASLPNHATDAGELLGQFVDQLAAPHGPASHMKEQQDAE